MTMRVVALVAGVVACAATVMARRDCNQPIGLIKGRVIDQTNGQPVPDTLVTLSGSNPARRIVVGAGGLFEFSSLPAGSYGLLASRPGYLPSSAGQRSPTGIGRPIAISTGADQADIVVPLWKAGSIAGSVMTASFDSPDAGVEGPRAAAHAGRRILAMDRRSRLHVGRSRALSPEQPHARRLSGRGQARPGSGNTPADGLAHGQCGIGGRRHGGRRLDRRRNAPTLRTGTCLPRRQPTMRPRPRRARRLLPCQPARHGRASTCECDRDTA